MTYEVAEQFASEKLKIIRNHNDNLTGKYGYRIRETIIAPLNSDLKTIINIFINLTHNIDNRKSLVLFGLTQERFDVFIITESQMGFGKTTLKSYLQTLNLF